MDTFKKIKDKLIFRIHRKYIHLADRKYLKDFQAFKNIHSGKRCFIVGSGPSIKNQNVEKLKDEWTFVMNTFCLHEHYDKIHPKFYVIFHSEYLSGNQTSIEFLKTLDKKVHPDTVMILPLKSKRIIEENNVLSKNKKLYVYVKGFLSKERTSPVDMTKSVPTPMSTSVMCLMAAIYMGFDPIYLMGLEHNWLAMLPGKEFQHFSDGKSTQFLHRNPNESYEQDCWTSYLLFRNYRFLKNSSKSKIYNLTPNSFLDTFPFAIYEEIISKDA